MAKRFFVLVDSLEIPVASRTIYNAATRLSAILRGMMAASQLKCGGTDPLSLRSVVEFPITKHALALKNAVGVGELEKERIFHETRG